MFRDQVELFLRLQDVVKALFLKIDEKFVNDPVNWEHYTNKVADIKDKRLKKNVLDVGFVDCLGDLKAAEREFKAVENALNI